MNKIITTIALLIFATSSLAQTQPKNIGLKPCFIKLSQTQYVNANKIISSRIVKSALGDGEEYATIIFVLDGIADERVSLTLQKNDAERFMDDFYNTYSRICK